MPDGKPGFRRNGTKAERQRGPWERQDPEDQLFATVSNKGEVGKVIHRAQLAILNPSTPPDRYKPGADDPIPTSLQVKFSPNCVRVEVSIVTNSCCLNAKSPRFLVQD